MVPMPWNLSMQPIYIVHFPSPKSFMLVNLINSPILLYPFKTDNIVGYSLFLNSLLFLKDSWFWVLSHCLFLLSPCCLLILSDFEHALPQLGRWLLSLLSALTVYSTKFCCLICHAFKVQSYTSPQLTIKYPATWSLLPHLVAEFCPKSKLLPFQPHQCHPMKIYFFPVVQFKIVTVIFDFFSFFSFYN